MLLFYKYGITPTANKLYQYVRKGSMSAPAEALNKFWLELRDKSRVRIERTDLPDHIVSAAGDLIATMRNEAQKAAQEGFSELAEKALIQIQESNSKTELAERKIRELHEEIAQNIDQNKNLLKRLSESENKHVIDMSALTDKEKSLIALRNEKLAVEAELKKVQGEFSVIADKLHNTLAISEERYGALESKLLSEIDHERQQAIKLDKEVHKLNQSLSKARIENASQLKKKEIHISILRESIGILKGQLKESHRYQASAMKMLNKNTKGKNKSL